MAVIRIPVDRGRNRWRVGRTGGQFLGQLDVAYTFNMDFEKSPGYARLSDQASIVTSDTEISGGFSLIKKFVNSDADDTASGAGSARWWALASDKLLRTAGGQDQVPTGSFSSDTLSGSPTTTLTDMVVHEQNSEADRLIVSGDSTLSILNSSDTDAHTWITDWWDDSSYLNQPALKTGVPHPIGKLERILAIGDGNLLHTIDQNDVVVYQALTFEADLNTRLIYNSRRRFWIGLTNQQAVRNGAIVEWDGFSPKALNNFALIGNPLSGWISNEVPYFVTSLGSIVAYNGNGFEEVAHFPDIREQQRLSIDIEPYGCTVDGDIVRIMLSTDGNSYALRSGIWIFNMRTRDLYHSVSAGDITDSDTRSDFGQGVIADSGAIIDYLTGNRIVFGARVYDVYTGTQKDGIFSLSTSFGSGTDNRGYFVTGKIPAERVDEVWSSIWTKFRKYFFSGNIIGVKYRTTEEFRGGTNLAAQNATITWSSTTQFTAVVPTGVKIGDEVEVLAGDNAGCLFHISALSATPDGSSTITVTVDEAAPFSSTSDAFARFDNWRRCLIGDSDYASDSDARSKLFTLPGTPEDTTNMNQINRGTFVEFKVELRGVAHEIEELIAKSRDGLNI